jgi:hypothetical protein
VYISWVNDSHLVAVKHVTATWKAVRRLIWTLLRSDSSRQLNADLLLCMQSMR